MSDTPQGPDWYKASDDKWYPPQPPAPPPGAYAQPPQPQKKSGCLKVALILLAIFVALGIVSIIAFVFTANKVVNEVEKGIDATENRAIDPANPDAQKEDQNVALGESVRLSGYTTVVTSAEFQPTVSEFETDGYLVVDVTIANRDAEAQPYNYFDFKLQTPKGQVIDPTVSSIEGALNAGDLIKGGTVSGKIVWEVGATKGDFFVIYKPDPFDAARGLWKVTL